MRARFTFLVALPLSLPQLASSATYTLTKTWAGNDFLSSDWVWYTGHDLSNGCVNYVTKTVAEQEGLVQSVSCCGSSFSVPVGLNKHQHRARCFSCVLIIFAPSAPYLGETASESALRNHGTTPYSYSTSSTCLQAAPPRRPFGR